MAEKKDAPKAKAGIVSTADATVEESEGQAPAAAPEEPAVPMTPETPVEEEEDVDMVIDEPAPLIDFAGLAAEAKLRRQAMESRPERGLPARTTDDIDKTFAAFVIQLMTQSQQALSDAIRAEAERRSETLDTKTKSATYKRQALANQVLAGKFDS